MHVCLLSTLSECYQVARNSILFDEYAVVLFSTRWLDYKAVGKRLFGTRFIAFKVPLKPVRLIPSSLSFSKKYPILSIISTKCQHVLV